MSAVAGREVVGTSEKILRSLFGRKRRVLLILLVAFFIPATVAVAAQRVELETKHTILHFNSVEDMERFSGNIDFPSKYQAGGLFSTPTRAQLEKHLIDKVDNLFQKVQLILDMRKPMKKVRVKVHSSEEELARAYKLIYKSNNHPRGWYIYKYNTIYLNAGDVHEGMFAHELGHAVIDNYLSVKPPRATAEILAKYVDLHLFDEVKKY
jgi:hypothetical protein